MKRSQRRLAAFGIGSGVVLAAAGAGGSAAFAVDPADLESRVTVEGVYAHLEALQAIADANDGNRAIGTSGYEASGAYIEEVLTAAGYSPVRQEFQATSQSIDAFSITLLGTTQNLDTVDGDRIPMEGTTATPEAGIVGAELVAPATATGCNVDEWGDVDATGKVAVVSRGICSFAEKDLAAAAAGAVAVLVYNSEEGPLNGTLGEQLPEYIPAVGLTQAEGQAVLAALAEGPQTVDLQLQETTTSVDTFNIIAETSTGRADNTVMLGAHLDSVPEGAGINDNGSGSAAILETAVQLAASGELNNQVRFAWWGAEEVGLVGSTHYVEDLAENDPAELDEIATYLNFDMVASPNYVISVYDADQSTFEAPVEVPEGSIATEKAFTDYFDAGGQPWIDTAFDARSDYDAFITYGVPASGLFTGADDVKTAEQVALFGGTEGIIQDPNYHTAGDDISNVNTEALGIMIGAIASVTGSLANDTSAINGVLPPVVPTPDPTVTPTPTPTPTTGPAGGPGGELAATGANAEALNLLPLATLVLAAGVALVAVRMRRPTQAVADQE
ncbi:M20/M25/M40 family metallo-hydrolase [Herbiconiux sp. CPCC 203407]|uniref:M20/M25/M40 family metallo-hydrolase n=1 Tax=Herbiconiux oxytropis TaxID=2970915 RepID=A0AA41XDN9_9MICO|nr:M20/M25/M40 family metallo-hydrolase [Herbiconiux oxytropis]MCS5721267.1 M20/M25/M40 family metallo-hydrolase [Herbiconiux oxytropis]MCS5726294.1 M20/M25/M40 family metallo-hydrolase [Herbiconiux oxytropis]